MNRAIRLFALVVLVASTARAQTPAPLLVDVGWLAQHVNDRGLVLLSCGIYGNVIRILVPLTIDDALLERGLDLLEESLGDARAG